MESNRVEALIEAQGDLLREVRGDVKQLNHNVSHLCSWRDHHAQLHLAEDRDREIWQGRFWALVAPYVVGAIALTLWLVLKAVGLV